MVSICIPCYNASQFIGQTLNALIKQQFNHIEIIVVDNGSFDDSAKIILNIAKRDCRIQYHYCENNGAAAARNFAFLQSKGDYIIYMDADDLVPDNYVFELLNTIKNSKNDIAACSYRRFFYNDLKTALIEPLATWKDLKPISWLLIDNGKGLGMMQSGMFLIPRNLILLAGGWDESLSLIDDFEFFPRLFLLADMIIFCTNTHLYYRSGNDNTLSGQLTSHALNSAYKALALTTKNILQVEDTTTSRSVLATYWSLWAYHFYPEEKQLLKGAQDYVKKLSGKKISPMHGGLTKQISYIVGWRLAKRIKTLIKMIK